MLDITVEHVKELATLSGNCVLVPMPCEHPPAGSLWVISTANKHYDGAATVYATGDQVGDLASDYDGDAWNENGELTDKAAEEIAKELAAIGRAPAIESAEEMPFPLGYTQRVMDEMSKSGTED